MSERHNKRNLYENRKDYQDDDSPEVDFFDYRKEAMNKRMRRMTEKSRHRKFDKDDLDDMYDE